MRTSFIPGNRHKLDDGKRKYNVPFRVIASLCFSISTIFLRFQYVNMKRFINATSDQSAELLAPSPRKQLKALNSTSTRRHQPWETCQVMNGFENIEQIKVADPLPDEKRPKIYCFLMTSAKRRNKFKTVFNTWGKKCDYLLIASDHDNPRFNAVKMKAEASYDNLWNKLNETLHYIGNTTDGFKDYDWFFKIDDDTMVIMENLVRFLQSAKVQTKDGQKVPLIYGRRFSWPSLSELQFFPKFFGNESQQNQEFKHQFYENVKDGERLIYVSGGAGYIMNRQYVRQFLSTLTSKNTLYGVPDEDMAVAVNMKHVGVEVQPAVDPQGLQLFHPESPGTMYFLPNNTVKGDWLRGNHKDLGGISTGPDCCSPFSISFHHISPLHMRYMQYKLYRCP